MKKASLPKPITILVLTLLTSVVWVGLSIYRAVTIKPNTEVPENISSPINPTLNTSVIDQIDSSIYFADEDVPEISIENNQTPEPVAAPIETPLPELEESPEGTPSATEI